MLYANTFTSTGRDAVHSYALMRSTRAHAIKMYVSKHD